jgi:hypothetical protein
LTQRVPDKTVSSLNIVISSMTVANQRLKWAQRIRSGPMYYPQGPRPIERPLAVGAVNGYCAGIGSFIGGSRPGSPNNFSFRLRQQSMLEKSPLMTVGTPTRRNLLMTPQRTVMANKAATTVIGTEICKFSTYHACEISPSPRRGVDQSVIASGPTENETGCYLRGIEKAATLACSILACAAVTCQDRKEFASGEGTAQRSNVSGPQGEPSISGVSNSTH